MRYAALLFLLVTIPACTPQSTAPLAVYEEDAAFYIKRGNAWHNKGEYDKAIADFNEAIKIDPKFALTYSLRGSTWREKGEHDKAIEDFSEAVRLDPTDAESYRCRGLIWSSRGEKDKAIADFNEAIQYGPQDAATYLDRADVWYDKGNYDKAILDQDEAIKINPEDTLAYNDRGLSWSKKNRFEEAIADFNKAIGINSKYALAYSSRAWIRATSLDARFRDGKQAVSDATKACELSEWKNAAHLDTLAAAYAETGEFDDAVRWQCKAIELTPTDEQTEYKARLKLYQAKKPFRY